MDDNSSLNSSCSSDFDAAETFAASLVDQVDSESVRNMVAVQRDMLSRFEKTNEMLINFNILSANRFSITSSQFRRHTQLLYDMKKDLDTIFKRIRVIKQKLAKSHPEAFKVLKTSSPLMEDEEEELETEEPSPSPHGHTSAPTQSHTDTTGESSQNVDNQGDVNTTPETIHSVLRTENVTIQ
ncbi:kxDL motif-containing protein 1-like [Mya arenaria]|uniref:kxDL motif-containing protein 1-like n=1 Tax=Mya arenaria TaxID=6604 RepID=UPI0022E83601|nr:kxDL motif-containing protein 1-like [Mya arenaria]